MGVLDTYLALILPYIAVAIAFNSLLFVGFLNDFPGEVEEAAIIDGCGVIKLCAQIIVPIIKPIFATVIVFNFPSQSHTLHHLTCSLFLSVLLCLKVNLAWITVV